VNRGPEPIHSLGHHAHSPPTDDDDGVVQRSSWLAQWPNTCGEEMLQGVDPHAASSMASHNALGLPTPLQVTSPSPHGECSARPPTFPAGPLRPTHDHRGPSRLSGRGVESGGGQPRTQNHLGGRGGHKKRTRGTISRIKAAWMLSIRMIKIGSSSFRMTCRRKELPGSRPNHQLITLLDGCHTASLKRCDRRFSEALHTPLRECATPLSCTPVATETRGWREADYRKEKVAEARLSTDVS